MKVNTVVYPVSTIMVDISVWSSKRRPIGSRRGFGEVKPLEMCVNPISPGKVSGHQVPPRTFVGQENRLKYVLVPITGRLSAYL